MTERLDFKSAGAVRPKPLWKMTNAELAALADSDDARAGSALIELDARVELDARPAGLRR